MAAQDTASIELIKSASATGAAFLWPGGDGVFSCTGTWGGATCALHFMGAGGNYFAAGPYTTLTADGGGAFTLPRGMIKAVITNAGSTTLTAQASQA